MVNFVDSTTAGARQVRPEDLNAAFASVLNSTFATWFATLPTTLPSTAGQPWNNGGTLSVS